MSCPMIGGAQITPDVPSAVNSARCDNGADCDPSDLEREVFLAVSGGKQRQGLFDRIDVRECDGKSSLQQVKGLPSIRKLTFLFTCAGLEPKLGYNPGTSVVSFTMPFPGGKVAADVQSLRSAILCLALGVHPAQAALEAAFSGSHPGDLLANQCLAAFLDSSGVAITGISVVHGGLMRVTVCDGRQCRGLGAQQTAFRWAPSYLRLLGYTPGPCTSPTPQSVNEAASTLVESMVCDFWQTVETSHYIADSALRQSVTEFLRRYLRSGIRSHQAQFRPRGDIFQLYMWGRAGVGKSEFIKQLRSALEDVLVRFVDPDVTVSTVKVLLNAMTTQSLKAVANVKGISDMSIERLCEQSLAKGHIVILHLEENPEEPGLQRELYEVSHSILTNLLKRYSTVKSHIIYIYTSNYPAADTIAQSVQSIQLLPPAPEECRQWALSLLRSTVQELSGASSVELWCEMDMTHVVNDMRKLRQWWMSLSYLISAAVRKSLAAGSDLEIRLCGDAIAAVASVNAGTLEIAAESSDGAFYYDSLTHALPLQPGIPVADHPTVLAILDMFQQVYLQPAVLVLQGAEEDKARCFDAITAVLCNRLDPRLHTTELDLQDEDDKVKVFGSPSEIQGGLFKFINSVVGTLDGCSEPQYAVILSHVSVTGQFMLRELLESGASSTHRLGLCKERVLFVLSVNDGDSLQPQLLSRAHAVVQCSSPQ